MWQNTEGKMNKPVGIVLVGPGLIGKKHAELIDQHSACSLACVVAPDREQNRAIADKYGAEFTSNLDDALGRQNVDGVIVSSPNGYHFDQSMACISRGLPVLVEKPLTDDIATARKLAQAAADHGVPVLVGHHRTHSSLLAPVEAFLRSPEFGRLVCVNGAALFYKPEDYFREGEWRTRIGGGPILINIIHEIGLMRHFCGEIQSVFAVASNQVRGFEVEDTVALTFVFDDGVLGSFILSDAAASSKSWEMTSGENPAYPHYPEENCYHFAGTMGSIDFPSMQTRSYLDRGSASWWHPFKTDMLDVARTDPLQSQLSHFLEVVRGTAKPLVSARDGYRNLLVIEAIKRSLQTGQTVLVEDLDSEVS